MAKRTLMPSPLAVPVASAMSAPRSQGPTVSGPVGPRRPSSPTVGGGYGVGGVIEKLEYISREEMHAIKAELHREIASVLGAVREALKRD